MFTRYEIEDITFDEVDDIIEEAKKNTTPGAGGTSASPTATPTKTPTPAPSKRILEDHTEAMLRQMWRAGRLTEAEWRAELEARTGSAQAAADKIAYQKTVGITSKGELTDSEARAVNALKGGPTAAAQTQQVAQGSQAVFDAARNAWSTATGYGGAGGGSQITPPSLTGGAGLADASGSSAAASGGSGGSSASAPSAPKAPLPNSAQDLQNRGARKVGTRAVLDGTQYAPQGDPDPSKVPPGMQFSDMWPDYQARPDGSVGVMFKGTWYPLPPGSQEDSTATTQLLSQLRSVYNNLGPAITSNPYAAIGQAALDGPMRRRVGQGSGQNQAVNLDDIIGLSYQSGQQPGEFMGSSGAFGNGPVDVLRGNVGIPDYGGMRQVPGGGFTGRMLGDDGQEVAIGQGGSQQGGTAYGSHTQMMFAPYLSESQIGRLNPEQIDALTLRLGTLRDQGLLQQADALTPTSGGGYKADTAQQAANYSLLTGEDPYNLDILPTPMATGGSVMPGFGREMNMMRRPMGPRGFGTAPQPVTAPGMMDSTPPIPQSYLDRGGYMDENRPMQIMGRNPFGQPYAIADLRNGAWNFRGPRGNFRQMMMSMDLNGNGIPDYMERDEVRPAQDIWRGLMADSDSWYTGPAPDGSEWNPRPMGMGGSVMTKPVAMAEGGQVLTSEWQQQEAWDALHGGTALSSLPATGGIRYNPNAILDPTQVRGLHLLSPPRPDPYLLQDPTTYTTFPWTGTESYASGGSMVPPEPVRVQGMNTGTNYAVAGAQPELMTVSGGGVGFEPLGGPMQQQQGMMQEQQMAAALGPASPPPRPLFAQPVMVNPNRRGRPFKMEDPLMTLSKMRGVA